MVRIDIASPGQGAALFSAHPKGSVTLAIDSMILSTFHLEYCTSEAHSQHYP